MPEFYLMFTGIIEAVGRIEEAYEVGTNRSYWISSPLSNEFTIDQSIAHDGVCLTIEEVKVNRHRVTAVKETLDKTALSAWIPGRQVNLEQAMLPTKRLDGHFVQGHVDAVGTCKEIADKNGSYEITFDFPEKFAALVIEKGSISLNGISLTIFNVGEKNFTVAVIPYTWQHTNLRFLKMNNEVNLEFDLLGKYIQRKLDLRI